VEYLGCAEAIVCYSGAALLLIGQWCTLIYITGLTSYRGAEVKHATHFSFQTGTGYTRRSGITYGMPILRVIIVNCFVHRWQPWPLIQGAHLVNHIDVLLLSLFVL
jgi:hypothetical protein